MTPEVADAVRERAGGHCERCGNGERPAILHHTSYPQEDTPANLLLVCRPCHHVLHAEPDAPNRPPLDLLFPIRITAYTDQRGAEVLARLAEKWEISESGAVRRLLRETAKREGLDPGPR